jgi:hypothetical protein
VLTIIIPEPSSLVLLATALPMVAYALRQRRHGPYRRRNDRRPLCPDGRIRSACATQDATKKRDRRKPLAFQWFSVSPA